MVKPQNKLAGKNVVITPAVPDGTVWLSPTTWMELQIEGTAMVLVPDTPEPE